MKVTRSRCYVIAKNLRIFLIEMNKKNMDVHETIKDIKGQFRLFMNGVASQSMREKGLDYKLNFGIELPRLKEIAARYEKNHEVAQALWKEISVNVKFWRGCYSR